ncbi:MAG TPA: hypothetical protein VMS86_10200 [Thermoanaerobaculia bacterium]|nr:hypothetical protein [Thermoanaerobaculia bacterium]
MSDRILEQRRKGLEESFFAKHNRELLEKLRQKTDAAGRREQLITVSGIHNEALLDELVALGLDAESLAALGLIPLLQVAWADGKVQPREHDALLEAARKAGVEPGSTGYEMLLSWIDREPDPKLFQAWKDYVRALRGAVSEGSLLALRVEVLDRAKAVARAAGGILGIGSIWGTERNVLEELEDAFKE